MNAKSRLISTYPAEDLKVVQQNEKKINIFEINWIYLIKIFIIKIKVNYAHMPNNILRGVV